MLWCRNLFLLFLTFFLAIPLCLSQSLCGTDFWFTFSDNGDRPYATNQLVIVSSCQGSGTVDFPRLPGLPITFTVSPGIPTMVNIPVHYNVNNETMEDNGFRISSNVPVAVYAINYLPFSVDASIVHPMQDVGSDYAVMSYTQNNLVWGEPDQIGITNSRFTIVATQDDTDIDILLSDPTTTGRLPGSSWSINMDAGQTYMVTGADHPDTSLIAGTHVKSNKPVVLIGNVSVSRVGRCQSGDVTFDQLLPIDKWGTRFVLAQVMERRDTLLTMSDIVQIVSGEDGARVRINNWAGDSIVNLGSFDRYHYENPKGPTEPEGRCNVYIESDNPIQVLQLNKGTWCDSYNNANPLDPIATYIFPLKSWRSGYNMATSTNITSASAGMVITVDDSRGATGSFILDGNPVSAAGWLRIGTTNYRYKRIEVVPGYHSVENTMDEPFGIYQYALGTAESFSVQGGGIIYDDCDDESPCPKANFIVESTCKLTKFAEQSTLCTCEDLEWEWDFGDGSPISNEQNPIHEYPGPGIYTVTMTVRSTCDPPCEDTQILPVVVPNGPEVDAGENDSLCYPDSLFFLIGQAEDGTPGYTWHWSPEESLSDPYIPNPEATPDSSETYTVEVVDQEGCKAIDSVTVKIFPPVKLDILPTDPTCFGYKDGQISASALEGTGEIEYEWSPVSSANAILTGVGAGTYELLVTDEKGCTRDTSVALQEPEQLFSELLEVEGTTCMDPLGFVRIICDGGTPPYKHVWEGPASGSISGENIEIRDLPPGDYSLLTTDDRGCTQTLIFTIAVEEGLEWTYDTRETVCSGSATGFCEIEVSHGQEPYSFSWNGGPFITGKNLDSTLYAGKHTVIFRDSMGCEGQISFEIPDIGGIELTLLPAEPVSCMGKKDGSITSIITGGKKPYQYHWGNLGWGDSSVNGLGVGWYYLSITDSEGCVANDSIYLEEGSEFQVALVASEITCPGGNDAGIVAIPENGTGPYSYSWNTGDSTTSLTNIGPGSYEVVVQDAESCKSQAGLTIFDIDPIMASTTANDEICMGNNGSIQLDVSGGNTGNYKFIWSNGAESQNIEELTSGIYACTIADSKGCTITLEENVGRIPANLNVKKTITPEYCENGKGTIQLITSGGTEPYVYKWGHTPSTSANQGMLNAGIYAFTVTDPFACELQDTVKIPVLDGFEIQVVRSPVSCFGGADGSASVSISQAPAGNVQVLWSGGSQGIDPMQRINLIEGDYTVRVEDQDGCFGEQNFSISEPDPLVLSVNLDSIYCFGDSTGSISLNALGGTPGYRYNWDGGFPDTAKITQLPAATYIVLVMDENNCSLRDTFTLSQPDSLSIQAILDEPLCFGDANGKIIIQSNGGIPPYSYNWLGFPGNTSPVLSDIPSGNYTFVVRDLKGCEKSKTVFLENPDSLYFDLVGQDVSCYGLQNGKAEISQLSGNAPFEIQWSSNITDPQNLGPGSYKLTVLDKNGCERQKSFDIDVPDSLATDVFSTPVLCFGDEKSTIRLDPKGGTKPYTINWDHGTVGAKLQQMGAGNYSFTVTDSAGCILQGSVFLGQPDPLFINGNTKDCRCSDSQDGEIVTTGGGGVPPYSWSWSDFETGEKRSMLSSGSYTLSIVDQNGCALEKSWEITAPKPIDYMLESRPGCPGQSNGSVYFGNEISGGTPGYDIRWSNGSTKNIQFDLISGWYAVTVSDARACTRVKSIELKNYNGLEVDAGPDLIISPGDRVELNAHATPVGNYQYHWQHFDSEELTPGQNLVLYPIHDQKLMIHAYDAETRCSAMDSLFIEVREAHYTIPNAFTPNGDGINDKFWLAHDEYIRVLKMQIYNRWGELLYEGTGPWDGSYKGETQPISSYAYIFYLENRISRTQKNVSGNVTLLE